jgi:cytochrome c
MKRSSSLWVFGASAAMLLFAADGALALDDEATKALLKKNECTKCHAVDKDKKGPSYQKIAKDNKGKADAEDTLVKFITSGPKIKLSDGTEEEHKRIASKDPAEVKGVVLWILKQ